MQKNGNIRFLFTYELNITVICSISIRKTTLSSNKLKNTTKAAKIEASSCAEHRRVAGIHTGSGNNAMMIVLQHSPLVMPKQITVACAIVFGRGLKRRMRLTDGSGGLGCRDVGAVADSEDVAVPLMLQRVFVDV